MLSELTSQARLSSMNCCPGKCILRAERTVFSLLQKKTEQLGGTEIFVCLYSWLHTH